MREHFLLRTASSAPLPDRRHPRRHQRKPSWNWRRCSRPRTRSALSRRPRSTCRRAFMTGTAAPSRPCLRLMPPIGTAASAPRHAEPRTLFEVVKGDATKYAHWLPQPTRQPPPAKPPRHPAITPSFWPSGQNLIIGAPTHVLPPPPFPPLRHSERSEESKISLRQPLANCHLIPSLTRESRNGTTRPSRTDRNPRTTIRSRTGKIIAGSSHGYRPRTAPDNAL